MPSSAGCRHWERRASFSVWISLLGMNGLFVLRAQHPEIEPGGDESGPGAVELPGAGGFVVYGCHSPTNRRKVPRVKILQRADPVGPIASRARVFFSRHECRCRDKKELASRSRGLRRSPARSDEVRRTGWAFFIIEYTPCCENGPVLTLPEVRRREPSSRGSRSLSGGPGGPYR